MTAGPGLDPYATLQVVPTAEQEVGHAADRALAFTYHPDSDAMRRAAEKMAALNHRLWLSRHSSGIRYRTEIHGILRTMGVSAA